MKPFDESGFSYELVSPFEKKIPLNPLSREIILSFIYYFYIFFILYDPTYSYTPRLPVKRS